MTVEVRFVFVLHFVNIISIFSADLVFKFCPVTFALGSTHRPFSIYSFPLKIRLVIMSSVQMLLLTKTLRLPFKTVNVSKRLLTITQDFFK